MGSAPSSADTVNSLFQNLVDAVEAEIVVLRQIGQELTTDPSPLDFATKLKAMLDETAADVAGKPSDEVARMARYWSTRYSGIQRIVDTDYEGSQYNSTKKSVEKVIVDTSNRLYALTKNAP